MEKHDQEQIIEKAVDIASEAISSAMADERFEHLSDTERALAVVQSVAMGGMIALNTLADLFGEDFVEQVMSLLEKIGEAAEAANELHGHDHDMFSDIDTDMDDER